MIRARITSLSLTIRLQRSYSTFLRETEIKPRMSVQQPPWLLPERRESEPVLKIFNSLTRTKVGQSHGLIASDLSQTE